MTYVRHREKRPSQVRGVVGIVVGLAGVLYGMFWPVMFARVLLFRRAEGIVISKSVEKLMGAKRVEWFQPRIRYRYVVNGEQFEGNTYRWLDEDGGEAWANEKIGQYNEGEPCIVFYELWQPKVSTLSRAPSTRAVLISLLAPLISIYVLLGGILEYRNAKMPRYLQMRTGF